MQINLDKKALSALGLSQTDNLTKEVLDKALIENGGSKAPKNVQDAYQKLVRFVTDPSSEKKNDKSPVKVVVATKGSRICDHCDGTGDEPGKKGKSTDCPTCTEMRKKHPRLFEGNMAEECTSCGGKGHGSDHDVTCPGCGGSTIYNVPCDACKGEGCLACKGRGYVKSITCKRCDGTGTVCPDCDRGLVKIRKCTTCKGTAKIIQVPNCTVCGGKGFIEPKDEPIIPESPEEKQDNAAA